METPERERNHDLLSGYVAGIAGDYPDIVEALKRKAAHSPELAPGLPLICWRLGITASDIGLVIDALQAGLLPPPALMRWTSGSVLAKVPVSSVVPLIDVMLDHGTEAFAVAMGLMESCARGTPGKIAGFRPQIRKSVESFTRWKELRKQQKAAADFELIVHWMLEQGREDGDACATALALAKALVNDEADRGEDFIEPMIPMLLSDFPEIAWPLIGQAIVSDQQQAWRLARVLRGRRPADGESNPIILSLPEYTLFAWCHADPDRAPAFAAGVVPILAGSELEASERSLHPVMIRLLDEFGDREGVLQAVLDNMHNFTWSGSLASRFALYEEPLRDVARPSEAEGAPLGHSDASRTRRRDRERARRGGRTEGTAGSLRLGRTYLRRVCLQSAQKKPDGEDERWDGIHRRTGPGHTTASRVGEPTASPRREITPRRPRRHLWRYRRSAE